MSNTASRYAVWMILLAAAGTFALTMGTRQTMGLFLSDVNSATGLGIATMFWMKAYFFKPKGRQVAT